MYYLKLNFFINEKGGYKKIVYYVEYLFDEFWKFFGLGFNIFCYGQDIIFGFYYIFKFYYLVLQRVILGIYQIQYCV